MVPDKCAEQLLRARPYVLYRHSRVDPVMPIFRAEEAEVCSGAAGMEGEMSELESLTEVDLQE